MRPNFTPLDNRGVAATRGEGLTPFFFRPSTERTEQMRKIGFLLASMASALLLVGGVAMASHDTGWPRLQSSKPAPGKTITRSANVTVEFSESLDRTTLKTPDGENNVEIYKWNATKQKWVYVVGGVSCDAACDTVKLNPYPTDSSRRLAAGKYRAVVWRDSVGVRGADGNPLSDVVDIFAGYKLGPNNPSNTPPDSPNTIYWGFKVA